MTVGTVAGPSGVVELPLVIRYKSTPQWAEVNRAFLDQFFRGCKHFNSVKLTQISCVSGRAGETAAAGQPHTGGLWQREDRQERQLLQICTARLELTRPVPPGSGGDHIHKMCFLFFRVNSFASILTWPGTSSVPTLRPVSFYIASTHQKAFIYSPFVDRGTRLY